MAGNFERWIGSNVRVRAWLEYPGLKNKICKKFDGILGTARVRKEFSVGCGCTTVKIV